MVSESGSRCIAELRWLTEQARGAGADPQRTEQAAAVIVDTLLDSIDPRTRRNLALADRVRKAHEAGVSIADLRQRFGGSRSRIYRLLRLSRDFAGQSSEKLGP